MKDIKKTLSFTLPLLIAVASLTAQETQTAPTDPKWQDAVKQLASPDFATREAAQKVLDQATYKDLDTLHKLADAATDPEAKSRIGVRIDAIEEQVAVNPPPISIDLKDATLATATEELGKAVGIKMDSWPPNVRNNRGQALFNLTAHDEPFWQVFSELSRQLPLNVESFNNFRIMQSEPGMSHMVATENSAIVLFPEIVSLTKNVNLQAAAGKDPAQTSLTLSYRVAIDPRLRVSGGTQSDMLEVTDDLGNTLYKQPSAEPHFWAGQQEIITQNSVGLTIPDKMGTKIVSAKGEVHLKIQLAKVTTEIKQADLKLNTPIAVGNRTVTFTRFDAKDNNISLQVNASNNADAPGIINRVLGGQPETPEPIHMVIVDSNNTPVWTTEIQGGLGGGYGGQFVPPLKIQLSVSTKTKILTVPFELKDLPLPK